MQEIQFEIGADGLVRIGEENTVHLIRSEEMMSKLFALGVVQEKQNRQEASYLRMGQKAIPIRKWWTSSKLLGDLPEIDLPKEDLINGYSEEFGNGFDLISGETLLIRLNSTNSSLMKPENGAQFDLGNPGASAQAMNGLSDCGSGYGAAIYECHFFWFCHPLRTLSS